MLHLLISLALHGLQALKIWLLELPWLQLSLRLGCHCRLLICQLLLSWLSQWVLLALLLKHHELLLLLKESLELLLIELIQEFFAEYRHFNEVLRHVLLLLVLNLQQLLLLELLLHQLLLCLLGLFPQFWSARNIR